MNEARYAVYHAPALGSPWWQFGTRWVGRDEHSGLHPAQPAWREWTPQAFQALTGEPRRYGFHATLKAPFHLVAGVDEEGLRRRVDQLASQLRAVPLGRLEPARVDDFIALVPTQPSPSLDACAARCVTELDDLRAPLTPADLARRRPERLPARPRELLDRWGYPWVLDQFRFHMTLSGAVDVATGDHLAGHARAAVERLNDEHPPVLDRLCVFREERPGAPFIRIHDSQLLG